jgi:colanic acid biosynthesis glycosyl transferase WcaI
MPPAEGSGAGEQVTGLASSPAHPLTCSAAQVTFLTQLFYPELVSTGQTLTELAEELVELGVDVDVICGPPTVVSRAEVPALLSHQGITVRRVWGTRFPKLSLPGKLLNLVSFAAATCVRVLADNRRTPLLVVTNPPFLAAVGVLARWLWRRPYIFVVFDVYPDVGFASGVIRPGGLVSGLWDVANRLFYRQASAVVVLGECMAQVVQSPRKLGHRHRDRLHIIHIWADDRRIHPMPRDRSPLLARWGLADRFVLQYSGNMGRIHDMETILEGARRLASQRDIHFQFIGDGHKRAGMEAYVRQHNLGNCSFHDYVPREELSASLAVASVGVLSLARGQAGLAVPSKLFAVMAAGRPVIAVIEEQSEAARIVREEGCGYVIAPGDVSGFVDAVLRLKAGPQLAKEMGDRANHAVRLRYSLRAAAKRYAYLIRSLQPVS